MQDKLYQWFLDLSLLIWLTQLCSNLRYLRQNAEEVLAVHTFLTTAHQQMTQVMISKQS